MRQLEGETRVILARRVASVTAGHHHKLADLAGLDRGDDLLRKRQHLVVRKAPDDLARLKGLRGRTPLRARDDGREVLRPPLLAVRDMRHARIARDASRKDTAAVGIHHRHDAVRRHQDRPAEIGEVLLLTMPCAAVVALEVRILPKRRIGVGRQHLPVRIDVDARILRLLKELGEIAEVVSRHEDARTVTDAEVHARHLRVSISGRIGRVQKRHRADGVLAAVEDELRQLLRRALLAKFPQGPVDESVDRLVLAPEHRGMMAIGGDTLQPEQRQLLQAAQIGVRFVKRPRSLARADTPETMLGFGNRRLEAFVVEVCVRERQEKRQRDETSEFKRRFLLRRQVL